MDYNQIVSSLFSKIQYKKDKPEKKEDENISINYGNTYDNENINDDNINYENNDAIDDTVGNNDDRVDDDDNTDISDDETDRSDDETDRSDDETDRSDDDTDSGNGEDDDDETDVSNDTDSSNNDMNETNKYNINTYLREDVNYEDSDSNTSTDVIDYESDYTSVRLTEINEHKDDPSPLEHLYNSDNDNLKIDLFEKDIVEQDYFIIIENAYKDTDGTFTIFDPNSTVKTVLLDKTYNNVCKIDLIESVVKVNSGNSYETDPSGTPFIYLEVDELGSNYDSNNYNVAKAFKILSYYVELNSGTLFKHYTELDNHVTKYLNPRKSISSLTLRFKKPDGTNFTFSGSAITTATYWLTFKITCFERRLKTKYLDKTDG
tara:strand:+ start:88 stop:1215 length:1128 start_codon:yes stop_codon:yes gene_type:complete